LSHEPQKIKVPSPKAKAAVLMPAPVRLLARPVERETGHAPLRRLSTDSSLQSVRLRANPSRNKNNTESVESFDATIGSGKSRVKWGSKIPGRERESVRPSVSSDSENEPLPPVIVPDIMKTRLLPKEAPAPKVPSANHPAMQRLRAEMQGGLRPNSVPSAASASKITAGLVKADTTTVIPGIVQISQQDARAWLELFSYVKKVDRQVAQNLASGVLPEDENLVSFVQRFVVKYADPRKIDPAKKIEFSPRQLQMTWSLLVGCKPSFHATAILQNNKGNMYAFI